MNAIRLAAAAIACIAGTVHATEITEFPQPEPSTLTREAVRAEARAARDAGQLRHDESSPAVVPMSERSREAVRREAATAERRHAALGDYVGGM
ncbi:MAG TPA: DUF4148 domain-containing protein [Albitalea sp.]